MRVGKTTLVSHWLQDNSVWPLFPTWFSCVRGHPFASRLEHVQRGLEDQILGRFQLLPLPKARADERLPEAAQSERWSGRLREACAATDAVIDVVMDGLDEVRENDQEAVVDLVTSLPVPVWPSSSARQGLTPSNDPMRAVRFELAADRDAALRLIQAFAGALRGNPELHSFGERLDSDENWRNDLADRAGCNLWILTEWLDAILKGLSPPPAARADLSVRSEVKEYILQLLDEILEPRSSQERSKLRALVRTLALLDVGEETWAASDLQRLYSGLTSEEIEEAAEGPLRRLLQFQGGGIRFRDDTFRQIIADETRERDRSRGRVLAVALVDILGGVGQIPSPFLVEFATAQAASFVLQYADSDATLARRLLVTTPWLAHRFRQATAEVFTLGLFLEEMQRLFHAASVADQTGDISLVGEFLATLGHWRPAIEAGIVPGDQWWPRLHVVARGGIPGFNPPAASGARFQTVLLSPTAGYGQPHPANCELNGAACATQDGGAERIALAATRGRVLSYVKQGGEYVCERLHFFDNGAVAKLKALEGTLVLALTCSPGGKGGLVVHLFSHRGPLVLKPEQDGVDHGLAHDGEGEASAEPEGAGSAGASPSPSDRIRDQRQHDDPAPKLKPARPVERRLWLVDLASPLPPIEIDIPPETVDFAVLHAGAGCAVVVLAVGIDHHTEMRSYHLHYEKGLTPVSPPHLVGDGGVFRLEYQAKELCSFAPNTWAAVGIIGADLPGDSILTIHRHTQDGVAELTDPTIADVLRNFYITGVCSLPDNRLAAVRFPKVFDGEGAALLILSQAGMIDLQVPITPTPHSRVEVSLPSEVHSGGSYKPLGWHQHLHLLLGNSLSTYHCLTLQPEALPRPLPADIEQRILYSDDPGTTLYGACPLVGGRILLVFRNFAVVLGPGPSDISRVTSEKAGGTHLLGTSTEGSILTCDERDGFKQKEGFVPIRSNPRSVYPPNLKSMQNSAKDDFISLANDGTRLFAIRGADDRTLLYDASSDPGIPASAMNRRVLHIFTNDGTAWAAIVIVAHGRESADFESSNSESPTRYDFRIIGRAEGQLFGWTFPDVDRNHRDLYPQIEALSHGLLGLTRKVDRPFNGRGIIPYDPRQHRFGEIVLFDFLGQLGQIGDSDTTTSGFRLGTEEDRFYPPLVEVSPEWVLILGPLMADTMPGADDAVYRVYQYRVGSLEAPSIVEGLTLSSRVAFLQGSAGRVDLRDIRLVGDRTWVYVRQLGFDNVFGVRLLPRQPPPVDLGLAVHQVVDLDSRHLIVAYDAVPYRVAVRGLHPRQDEEMPEAVAVGYLAEPPRQVMLSRGPHGLYLVVATESDVTWFDLGAVAEVQAQADPCQH